ncbi:MAG: response regulator [Acidobacteriota bacterium]
MSTLTRLGLFDDHDIVRAGFRYILSEQDDLVIEAEGSDGQQALQAIRCHDLDVCVLDLSMPCLSGIDVLRQAKALKPQMAVLIMSAHSEEQYGLNVIKAGAAGFLSKGMAGEQLLQAVRTVASGRRYISPALGECLAAGLIDDADLPLHLRLSERELQIFVRLAKGDPVSQIAEALNLSPKTVSTYRSRVLEKMGLSSNAELARYAVTEGLLT